MLNFTIMVALPFEIQLGLIQLNFKVASYA